jgi:hypothetical protein
MGMMKEWMMDIEEMVSDAIELRNETIEDIYTYVKSLDNRVTLENVQDVISMYGYYAEEE